MMSNYGGSTIPVDRPDFKSGGRRHALLGGFDSHIPPPNQPSACFKDQMRKTNRPAWALALMYMCLLPSCSPEPEKKASAFFPVDASGDWIAPLPDCIVDGYASLPKANPLSPNYIFNSRLWDNSFALSADDGGSNRMSHSKAPYLGEFTVFCDTATVEDVVNNVELKALDIPPHENNPSCGTQQELAPTNPWQDSRVRMRFALPETKWDFLPRVNRAKDRAEGRIVRVTTPKVLHKASGQIIPGHTVTLKLAKFHECRVTGGAR
jgi:hypothetical protein